MSYLFFDGNNLAARCFYAQMELHTQAGDRSGLVHGFLKSLGAVRSELARKLENTCVFWDGGRSKRRIEIYPEYKKGRRLSEPQTEHEKALTASYKSQIRAVQKLLETRPIRQVRVDGVEADDMMSLLAGTVNDDVIIVSRDQDLHQLVTDKVTVYDAEHGLLTQAKVAEHWDLPQYSKDRILLLRALQGDKGDNIKGIPKIGPVRASQIEPYLKLEHGVVVQVKPCDHEPTQGRINSVLSAEGQETVRRNMALMQLPLDWQSTYYEPEQIELAMQQFITIPSSNWMDWLSRCASWDLEEIVQEPERWV